MCLLGEMCTCPYGIVHGGFDGAGGVGGAVSGSWRRLIGEVCVDGKGRWDGSQFLW